MKTAIIYEHTVINEGGEECIQFWLKPWNRNSFGLEGSDDGGKEYVLPEECDLVKNMYGEPTIWDKQRARWSCGLINQYGEPTLLTSYGIIPLKRKDSDGE